MTKEKVVNPYIVTPFGMLSYVHILKPVPPGAKHDVGIHKCSLYISKADLETPEGVQLLQAVLNVGIQAYNKPDLKLKDFVNPFSAKNYTNNFPADARAKTPEWVREGYFHITAKNHSGRPSILGPDKQPLSEEGISKIKAGHIGRFVVQPYYYGKGTTGVALALDTVQYKQPAKEFGNTPGAKAQELLTTIEVRVEDLEVSALPVTAPQGALALG